MLSHVNTEPTYDVYAAVQDTDLGSAAAKIRAVVADEQKQLKADTAELERDAKVAAEQG